MITEYQKLIIVKRQKEIASYKMMYYRLCSKCEKIKTCRTDSGNLPLCIICEGMTK